MNFSPGYLKAFRFTLLGEGMSEWAERALMVEETRAILDKYPQFNATLFDADSAVLTLIRKVNISVFSILENLNMSYFIVRGIISNNFRILFSNCIKSKQFSRLRCSTSEISIGKVQAINNSMFFLGRYWSSRLDRSNGWLSRRGVHRVHLQLRGRHNHDLRDHIDLLL